MSTRTLIVPYALGEAEPRVLMARVQMLQTRVRSKEIRGQVPSHAGQWVLMGGKAPDGMAADDAAYQLFRERTGLNLADPELLARYGFAAPRIEKLQDANYTPFTALFLETNSAGLDGFTAEIRNTINNNPETLVDGVYAEVEGLRQSQGLARIGPIPPPPPQVTTGAPGGRESRTTTDWVGFGLAERILVEVAASSASSAAAALSAWRTAARKPSPLLRAEESMRSSAPSTATAPAATNSASSRVLPLDPTGSTGSMSLERLRRSPVITRSPGLRSPPQPSRCRARAAI
jgi:hypothetical protein